MTVGNHLVSSVSEVRELSGEPGQGVLRKELDHLHVHCRVLWPSSDALPAGAGLIADHGGVGHRESWEAAIADSNVNCL